MANSHPRQRGKLTVFLFILVLAVAALGGWLALRQREKPVAVQTEKVTRRDLTEIVVANGRIQPVTQVKISPEVAGEIVELPVKEGQAVKRGDLLVRIKPDFYEASRNSARASFLAAEAGLLTAQANLERAEAEFQRNAELFERRLISASVFTEVKTARDIAAAQLTQARHQIEMARAALDKAEEDLRKTTIYSPIEGTVTRLISQVGERVVGTALMAGTDIMVLSDLNEMEARVDIGEVDVVLIQPGQTARLEVDAFKDRKFRGEVTEIGNSAKGAQLGTSGGLSGSGAGDATKFEVRIRLRERENFRPGMSVTAEIETRYRTNALAVPIGAVTARPPKFGGTNAPTGESTNHVSRGDKKPKAQEVVFVVEGDRVRQQPVKIGISDETHWEIVEGLKEGDEIVTGGFKAVTRELEDGRRIRKDGAPAEPAEKRS
jgi:HlyD family secretion protein